MRRKLQVFVSSTFNDMLPERQAAVEAILRAGHIPAGMELFAAGDESQLETIRRWIDDSDVFMLILGGRYGSIEPKSGKSYIELEYEYAGAKRKALFAAVISETYLTEKVKAVGPDAMERTNGHLLNAFRDLVTKKICRFFNDLNELKLIVFESLANFDRIEDLAGWIRGSDVVDPKATLEQAARVQAENAELLRKLRELEAVVALTSDSRQEDSTVPGLSQDAKDLLVAAKASGGRIMYLRHLSGAIIQAGGKEFMNSNNDRDEAHWKAAIDELRRNRLVEDAGSKGEIFRMTKRGYDVADEIEVEKQA
jgi:hypothetical protein